MPLSPAINVIPVASGKGGVGKSTVSANLALALAKSGARVGLMDADVYGPSIPTILGIKGTPQSTPAGRLLPVERYGVRVISMGFFIPAGDAVIWRGPMLHKMVNDFLNAVEWGELDYLIVDLPPGTGDVQLSLCQSIPVTGAVIVSTPQDVAWNVAQKAIVMFDKLNAPVLGIIENMSRYVCGQCRHSDEIFGKGGAKRAAQALGIPFLGEIPLVTALRQSADCGEPIVEANPSDPCARAIFEIAERLVSELKIQKARGDKKIIPVKIDAVNRPTVAIEWSDGRKSAIQARDLRLACPCAACVDESTGKKKLTPAGVSAEIRVAAFHKVGRYALQLIWSDGHSTGLYGFDYLLTIS
jgi:ATP-binding protein involved in chromosome partitioning